MQFLQALVDGILLGGVYAVISIGLTLVFGVVSIVNFAQAEFLMVGMFVAYFAWKLLGLDPLLHARRPEKRVTMTVDGIIARAENQAMVDLLEIPLVPVDRVPIVPETAVVMVDSQPNTGRRASEAAMMRWRSGRFSSEASGGWPLVLTRRIT